MRRWWALMSAVLAAYLATGLYVVRGNEKGVVRRCGRVVTSASGEVQFVGSGLHFDLPWPFSRVDRVNLSEAQTLTIGAAAPLLAGDNAAAGTLVPDTRGTYLTGDKNILQVQVAVQYRVSESRLRDYLFRSVSPEAHLHDLAEAAVADLIAQSGVDFVHPLGLPELRQRLTDRLRRDAEEQRLGLEVDEVTITAVAPPARVKADFLDVSNARADRERAIHTAQGDTEQRRESARAEAQEIRDVAERDRRRIVEAARGSADRFADLVEELRNGSSGDPDRYAQSRAMLMRHRYLETMRDVLSRAGAKVILDSGQPVDLTIQRPQEP